MGKKKPKEPQETPKSNGPSDIFSKLFGNVSEPGASSSLFSENNPFRKKPLETGSSFGLTNNTENAGSAVSDGPDSEVLKKGKKRKEKNSSIHSDNVFEASGKKSKSGSDLNPHSIPLSYITPQDDETEVSDLGAQATALSKEENMVSKEGEEKGKLADDDKEKRKKNKRKRDDVEKEWELKRYGAVEKDQDDGGGLVKNVGTKRKTVDNPADMLVTNEGFDDEKKLLRTIFVGNLPLKVKKKTLLTEFKKFGEVESVRIRSVPILDTKKPRKGAILSKKINDAGDSVHAYIVFKTEQSAQDSLSHNMALVGGNHIRVDRACPPRKKLKGEHTPLYDNKRTVFVGNLPFDVKDEELYKLFSGMSNLGSSIEAVRVIRDPHLNIGKGIAYVLFRTREAANFVVRKRNNLKLRDRELRLCHAKADATPSKRPNPSPPQASGAPAKKAAMASRSPSSTTNKTNKKSNMSYQGLRANKTVVHKKSRTLGGEQTTERKTKRPAVAARKAKLKAKLPTEDGSSKQAGRKRKLDSRTPDSSLRNKKIKKNR